MGENFEDHFIDINAPFEEDPLQDAFGPDIFDNDICQCGAEALPGCECEQCGQPLCPMCSECGANFCNNCPTDDYVPEY